MGVDIMDKKKCDYFIQKIFEMQEKSDSLNMEDEEMVLNQNKVASKSKEMYDFMADNLAPDERAILKDMMTKRNDAIENAHSRESFLFYKNGFLDGMGFFLNAVRYM